MNYTVTQAAAAKELNIAPQAITKALTNDSSKLEVSADKRVLVSSLLKEKAARLEIIANAFEAQPGECLCCKGPTNTNRKFISGHDARLYSAISTYNYHGTALEKVLIKNLLKQLNKAYEEIEQFDIREL